jgi:hypothetical protein
MGYVTMFINFISLDQALKTSPGLYLPALFTVTGVLITILVLAVLVGVHAGWGKKVPTVVKLATPVLNFLLYLFKTLLAVPVLTVMFVSLVPYIYNQFKMSPMGAASYSLGIFILIALVVIYSYVLTIFRETNPFSNLPYAG